MEKKTKNQMSFEEALTGLARSAETLKKEGTTLEDAMHSFEEGMAYHARCAELLSEAKQRILIYDRKQDTVIDFDQQ
ncbi:MAG: exodeoxyribonuclease VII small subunit [Firmicutes bacterium HGW-Firmicutes-11]|jgi:exodeoxyribonuclease VII small subunit|nr:MAG: exodeoxyribonuclease VII small subunit [Firmicutes bacterium HGW-Firmicutes-11]